MDRSNIIKLISEIRTQDEIGQWQSVKTARQVYCDVRSVSASEWFDAGRDGFKPSLCFIMFRPDYQGEQIVEYNGQQYGIYRTYVGRNERIELYTEVKGGIYGSIQETNNNP